MTTNPLFTASLKDWLSRKDIKIPSLYLVGGTVRDLLMNSIPKDIDLVCKNAKEFACSLARVKNAAIVSMEKKPDEPCYRVVNREDRADFLDIAEMRGETIYEDLNNRDFPINAIAIEVKADGAPGGTIDPLRGLQDIERKVIRVINERSFPSDPLRVLRAVRFAATLDFTIEPSTLEDMRTRASLIRSVSGERIMAELLFVLDSPRSSHFFRQMDDLGILESVIPEIMPMKGCAQNGFHHKDVWGHSLLVLENCERIINNLSGYFGDQGPEVSAALEPGGRLPLLKLAALLHDIGKPETRGLDPETGRTTFCRHDEEGARLLALFAERMKMSNQSSDFMVRMVAEHLHILRLSSGKAGKGGDGLLQIMKWFRRLGDDSVPAIILSMADVMSALGPEAGDEYREHHINWSKESIRAYYKEIKAMLASPNLVTGDDLLAIGLKPGPELGRVLAEVRDAQDTGEVKSREEALELAKALAARR